MTGNMPIDAIDLEVIKASLSGIVQEMQNSLFRTGFSTIVRESQDASCALMNAQGEVVAQHVVLPLHIGAFPACCAAVLRRIRRHDRGGRCVPDQSPYQGGSPHAPDMCVIDAGLHRRRAVRLLRLDRPQGRHRRPGAGKLLRPGARDLQRRPASAGGALPAQIHARRPTSSASSPPTAARRNSCSATSAASSAPTGSASGGCTSWSPNTARTKCWRAMTRLFEIGEARVRAAIAEWADGRYEAERFVDDDGIELEQPVRIHVVVEKKGDDLHFDFSGSADQTQGPANIRPPLVQAACAYRADLADRSAHVRVERAACAAFSITARDGSVLNPRFPAPVNTYNPTVHAHGGCDVRRAGADRARHACAPTARQPLHHHRRPQHLGRQELRAIRNLRRRRRRARQQGRRCPAPRVNQSNAKIAPIEIIESEFPTRLIRFELIRDSGGAGTIPRRARHPPRILNLADARFSIRSTKHVIPPNGMAGGGDGRARRYLDQSRTPTSAKRLPTRYADYPLKEGDMFRLDTPGGGGYGDRAVAAAGGRARRRARRVCFGRSRRARLWRGADGGWRCGG